MSAELKQYEHRFEIGNFLATSYETLETFVLPTISQIVDHTLRKVSVGFINFDDKGEFKLFLEQYMHTTSWRNPACRYDCAFLMNVPLKHIKRAAILLYSYEGSYQEDIAELAKAVYSEMKTSCLEVAQSALRNVFPDIYDAESTDRESYPAVIQAYVANDLENQEFRVRRAEEDFTTC